MYFCHGYTGALTEFVTPPPPPVTISCSAVTSLVPKVRIHQTLKISPTMAAGISKRLWEMKDVVGMLEAWETALKRT
jgi:hypothetical protein